MTEEQYIKLCEACDRVLLAEDSTLERVAIPWLHVIREHPVVIARYVDLFEPFKIFKAFSNKLTRLFLKMTYWLRQAKRYLRSFGNPWFGRNDLSSGIDVLFVSHLISVSHVGQEEDFYFDGLPNKIVSDGYKAVIALINQSGHSAKHFADKWEKSPVQRVILSGSLHFAEEINIRRSLKKEAFRLKKLSTKTEPELLRRVLVRASEEALSDATSTNLRMAAQISALVTKLNPKAIVVIHEGHSWERIAFAAARSANPNVQCIGYQHAAIFRLQHAIRRNLQHKYNPNQILTSGFVGKIQLEKAQGLKGIPITVLGSNRVYKNNNQIGQHLSNARNETLLKNASCLVIPEGLPSECFHLFEYSLECARAFPEIQFIWRLHPLLNYKSLAAKNSKLRNLPTNIELSQSTLEEDIGRCRWALYRGTTAIVQAVVAGLHPIYHQLPGEMTIDPLYELKNFRNCVNTVEDFQNVIKDDLVILMSKNESENKTAKEYCFNFFRSLDVSILESCLRVNPDIL